MSALIPDSRPPVFEPGTADVVRSFLKFARVVWQQKKLMAASLTIACLPALYSAATAVPRHEARCRLLVSPTEPVENQTELVTTHAQLFTSRVVLSSAAEVLPELPEDQMADFAGVPRENWDQAMHSRLSTRALKYTRIIDLSYRSLHPESAKAALQAIVQSGLAFEQQQALADTLVDGSPAAASPAEARIIALGPPLVSCQTPAAQTARVLSLCLLAGCATGLLLIYLRDLLDDRFRSADEVQQQLGLIVLAGFSDTAAETTFPLTGADRETFLALRTRLALAPADAACLAVAGVEETSGATSATLNLGLAFASAGRRTLLIDGNLIRSDLSKRLSAFLRPGLTSLLQDAATVATATPPLVRDTEVSNLWLLPSGPGSAEPADLLRDGRLAELLTWARANYDQVLIDCPSLSAGSDAALLGHLSGAFLLTLRPERQLRADVFRELNLLTALGLQPLGVVLFGTRPGPAWHHVQTTGSQPHNNSLPPVALRPFAPADDASANRLMDAATERSQRRRFA